MPARYYQRRVLERPLPNLERARPIEAENVMGVEAEIPIEAENPFAADNQIEAGDPIADENPIAAENQIEDENDAHADFGSKCQLFHIYRSVDFHEIILMHSKIFF